MRILVNIYLLFFCASPMLAQGAKQIKIENDSLEKYAEKIIKEYNIPGLQAALVSGDSIYNLMAVGKKKLGGNGLQTSTKMHLGSCGKAMTGYLAGVLVEEGKITWETTVGKTFPKMKKINPKLAEITLKQLLSHQAPIPEFYTLEEWNTLKKFKSKSHKKRRYQFAKQILEGKEVPFDSTDQAAKFRYSNAGYAIAAAMMENVSHTSYEELMEGKVFEPLGINAVFGWPAKKDSNESYGHTVSKKGAELIVHNPNGDYYVDPILSPAGNISMSIADYAKFLKKNLAGLNGKDNDYKKDFYEFLHYTNRPDSEYSIGWYSTEQFNDDLSTHTGSADTFYCLNLLLRTHNIGVIVIANAATEDTKIGAEKVRNYLLRPYLTTP